MTLEDFEKSLAEAKGKELKNRHRNKDSGKHRHHRHDHEDGEGRHQHKRRRRSRDPYEGPSSPKENKANDPSEPVAEEKSPKMYLSDDNHVTRRLTRDSWMEQPSGLDIEYAQKKTPMNPGVQLSNSSNADLELKVHENELNKHHIQNVADGKDNLWEVTEEPTQCQLNYHFGDSGAQWRMTRLKAVYRNAKETGRSVDEIAVNQFGDLRTFDDSREEQMELDRRDTYGEGYFGKDKPSGELFRERELELGVKRQQSAPEYDSDDGSELARAIEMETPITTTVQMDQSALNRLKAQVMKAKVRGSNEAADLEVKYNNAMAACANRKGSDVVILGAMENRMLIGGREGEVKNIENKRGLEKGLVEENEDMSIEDMVREERRTKNQAGGDGRHFAERIAKDGKFDSDLDYMDENAAKLAKRVQKSEIDLRNTAISDVHSINRALDNCPLCHHEDTEMPPVAPVVSLATRTYLTLPTEPEVSDGGACIIPIQHRRNLLECDDDEWEEIRNFMKSLIRMYHDQGRDVIFYENAAAPHKKKHAEMEVVPLPYSHGETAPAFFKEAILTSDEEWTQHKKIIDTLSKAKGGLGKLAFRRTLVKEMPYFHVWFDMDGGLGHIVEDANRWPKGDLFAREVIGGMLDKGPDIIKRQGNWNRGRDRRVDGFRKRWKKFDWTRVLTDS